jgi:enoyl-CoA hydratase/carnithine racemase
MSRVTLRTEGEVAIIELDSPGRMNAFTREMRAAIGRMLATIDGDAALAGAVITGAGEAFCAGQDFNESRRWGPDVPWVEEFEDFFRAILSFSKPLVAAVNGVAAGGGFQMALVCDRRVGHAQTRMGQTEVRWGLASVTGTWLLQRSVGDIRARELALSGRVMEAEELQRIGLLDRLVPREEVLAAAVARWRQLAESPRDGFVRTKRWIYENLSQEIARVCKEAAELHRLGFASGVSQEGAVRFLTH